MSWERIHSCFGLAEEVAEYDYPFNVHFLDVGQGDSSLIVSGENAVLIDGSERDYGARIVDYLYAQGVEKLDCVVATHPHADHIGGLIEVLKNFDVDNVLMPKLSEANIPTTKVYEDFLNAVRESGAKVFAAVPLDEYAYGEIKFTVFAPVAEDENLNNMSVVLRAEYGGTSFLFTGDAEKGSENLMLEKGYDISSTVIKIGHHGSNTSSSGVFMSRVSPSYAVISCGEGNSYGHPHREILSLLSSRDIEYFRTDTGGDIVFGVDSEVHVFSQK